MDLSTKFPLEEGTLSLHSKPMRTSSKFPASPISQIREMFFEKGLNPQHRGFCCPTWQLDPSTKFPLEEGTLSSLKVDMDILPDPAFPLSQAREMFFKEGLNTKDFVALLGHAMREVLRSL